MLKALHAWRDTIGRQEDESVRYVLPNAQLIRLATKLPTKANQVLSACSPCSAPVRSHAAELAQMIAQIVKDEEEHPEKRTIKEDINQAKKWRHAALPPVPKVPIRTVHSENTIEYDEQPLQKNVLEKEGSSDGVEEGELGGDEPMPDATASAEQVKLTLLEEKKLAYTTAPEASDAQQLAEFLAQTPAPPRQGHQRRPQRVEDAVDAALLATSSVLPMPLVAMKQKTTVAPQRFVFLPTEEFTLVKQPELKK